MRLLDTLRQADVVLAEDTRQTRKLLSRYDIHPPVLVSYHEHNDESKREKLQGWWHEGKRVALVSDAGIPLISDPGEDAVQQALSLGVPVIPIPGPNAALSALVASGFAGHPFAFLGFLPREARRLRETLISYGSFPGVLIIYESPHRLIRCLREIATVWPMRSACLAKEITKLNEQFIYGSVTELLELMAEIPPRGEYVLILGPWADAGGMPESGVRKEAKGPLTANEEQMAEGLRKVREAVTEGMPHGQAVRHVAAELQIRRKDLYQSSLQDRNMEDNKPSRER